MECPGLRCGGDSYGNGQHQLRVSGQVSYVAVQGDVFLGGTGLTDGERCSQDGVGPKLSCLTKKFILLVKNPLLLVSF